ncbi:MAG: hypothetical protein H0W83_15025 [Planctomycetes bacterium]|nr:hypothetical protein [Planctomycetota bacterium]
MKITIHGHLVPIPSSLALFARHQMTQALQPFAGAVTSVIARLVQTARNRPAHWVAVVDLGESGTVIVRSTLDDRMEACVDLAARAAASIDHRLHRPARASGRVHTAIRPPQRVRVIT